VASGAEAQDLVESDLRPTGQDESVAILFAVAVQARGVHAVAAGDLLVLQDLPGWGGREIGEEGVAVAAALIHPPYARHRFAAGGRADGGQAESAGGDLDRRLDRGLRPGGPEEEPPR